MKTSITEQLTKKLRLDEIKFNLHIILSPLLAVCLIILFSTSGLYAQLKIPQELYGVFDYGVPAYPGSIVYTQPSGQKITILLKGDGALNWAETTDGYKLIANNKGAFCYAIEDKEQGIKASNVEASDVNRRNKQEIALLKNINKYAFFTSTYIQDTKSSIASFLKSGNTPQRAFPSKGNRRLIAIPVEFTDVPFSKTQQDFDDLFNKKGYNYNGASGSVADYFYDNSFGTMNLKVDVVGPFKLSHNMAYYGAKSGVTNDVNPQAMVKEAIALADPLVDYSQYDNDKDGIIDGVYIIFSGYGQEAGASTDAIWAHASSISTVTYDNTKISRYSCSPELKGNQSSNGINKFPTHIGVICHEFLHVCGLPDYYDTDGNGSGGDSRDLGSWDPMASGSWNNGGRTPPYVNCFSRSTLGWGMINELHQGSGISLEPFYKSNIAYGISTITNEDYFFENRQQQGWDAYIPWHGMIIYHMQYDANRWKSNKVNVYPTHQCFDLVEATPNNTSDKYSPFPGLGNMTTFSAYTNPAFVNWDGSDLGKQITNIVENNERITFEATDYKKRNIYLKLTHNNTSILSFEATYRDVKYTSNKGEVILQVPVETTSITPQIAIANNSSFTKQITINSTDSVYTIPLKRFDFRNSGTYVQMPKATITIPLLAVFPLSGYEIASVYTPDFTSAITYAIEFDNGQKYIQSLLPNSSTATEEIELSYNQYVATITNGGVKVCGYELICNDTKHQSNQNGDLTLYIPTKDNNFTLTSTSNDYHKYQKSFENNGNTNNYISIEIMKRSQMEVMTIAPNPVKEQPMVIFVSEDGAVEFYTPMGNKLYSQDVKVGKNVVSARALKKGVILVQFKGKETRETKRALIL